MSTPHGPGTIAWQSAAAQALAQQSASVPVLLDRPPAGAFGGPMRFYFEYELQGALL